MKRIISLFYKTLIVLLALVGIILQVKTSGISNLRYYTLISNLVCLFYFSLDIILNIKKEDIYTFCPLFKSIATMGITVTMLVVIFVLDVSFPTTGLIGLSFLFLHYLVPILVIGDWIIFDKAGNYKLYYPFTNLILPFIYYIYIIILVHTGFSFSAESRYPYNFLDADKLGLGKVVIINIGITIFFIILGFIYYFIDNKIKKNEQ